MPKNARAPKSVAPTIVVFVSPEHIESNRTSQVTAYGVGHNAGFSIRLLDHGIEIKKEGENGPVHRVYTWSRVKYYGFDKGREET